MEIKNKAEYDPVADLYMVDAYMRWALLAAEEVVGHQGLSIVLRQAGLAQLINNYPPNELKLSGMLSYGDYANLSAGLLNFYGRAGKSMVMRIGRISAKHGIEQQGALFGLGAVIAAKVLPIPMQLKIGLDTIQSGFKKLAASVRQELHLYVQDRGDRWAYVAPECAMCAGKQADDRICWLFNGTLQESLRWQTGRDLDIQEVECRALGASACVWEVSKTPKG
ncbi:MAG: V4R domain-containing protein [Anaerolineales bacterium]